MSHFTLEAKRMLCPMPVIRTQDKIKTLSAGDVLEVVCTDPGALQDVPAWCRINGHKVLETKTTVDEVFIIIEVGDDGEKEQCHMTIAIMILLLMMMEMFY